MPYTPELIVKNALKNRHNITDTEQLREICETLFDLALRDKSAAEALFEKVNRFVQAIPNVITKEKLLQFARTYDEILVEKLILQCRLSNTDLGQEMRQELGKKPLIDKKLNDLLKRVQEIDIPQPAPQQPNINVISRTNLAIERNPLVIDRDNKKGVMVGDRFVPMVNRETRDFNQKLCSVGSSMSREVILLDPQDALLKALYQQLKKQLPSSNDPQIILEAVKKLTRECFKGDKPESFIAERLRNDKSIISLGDFIRKSEGVCRHHTLLNTYFLSRLVHDRLLKGDVIHHRQNFGHDGAHTWNIFQAQNGKVYSLDSLWNDVTCISDNPGRINSLYREDVEATIQAMHFSKPRKEEPVRATPEPVRATPAPVRATPAPVIINNQPVSAAEKLNHIKHYIENNHFTVGDYLLWQGGLMLKLEDGTEKRVPHRVYEMYQAIRNCDVNHPVSAQKAWETVQTHAQDALDNPRGGRDSKTTAFYNTVVNDNLVLLEADPTQGNKPR